MQAKVALREEAGVPRHTRDLRGKLRRLYNDLDAAGQLAQLGATDSKIFEFKPYVRKHGQVWWAHYSNFVSQGRTRPEAVRSACAAVTHNFDAADTVTGTIEGLLLRKEGERKCDEGSGDSCSERSPSTSPEHALGLRRKVRPVVCSSHSDTDDSGDKGPIWATA